MGLNINYQHYSTSLIQQLNIAFLFDQKLKLLFSCLSLLTITVQSMSLIAETKVRTRSYLIFHSRAKRQFLLALIFSYTRVRASQIAMVSQSSPFLK